MLAGASGGLYALMAAHVANLVINWSEMECAIVRAVMMVLLIVSDVLTAIYSSSMTSSGATVLS